MLGEHDGVDLAHGAFHRVVDDKVIIGVGRLKLHFGPQQPLLADVLVDRVAGDGLEPVHQIVPADEKLLGEGYSPSTINGKLTALDRFFSFAGWEDCSVKHLRVQRRMFREDNRELTREEYERLIETANAAGKERLALLMETICATE
mgnify:CR=1 FL=1